MKTHVLTVTHNVPGTSPAIYSRVESVHIDSEEDSKFEIAVDDVTALIERTKKDFEAADKSRRIISTENFETTLDAHQTIRLTVIEYEQLKFKPPRPASLTIQLTSTEMSKIEKGN
jgi:hypothetical protein